MPGLSISAAARETGLSPDVLRKWESRYGFPAPDRDLRGERSYPPEQVERLRMVKRLLDAGLRPSRVLRMDEVALGESLRQNAPVPDVGDEETAAAMNLLRRHDPRALHEHLHAELLRQGLGPFVREVVALLASRIGDEWSRGRLEIFEEHLWTEVIFGLLRTAITDVSRAADRPRLLLTTLPGERHGLGLLMVAGALAHEGADCILLGAETPVEQIAGASKAVHPDIVALSFSVFYPSRAIPEVLAALRVTLGERVEIWAGGGGLRRLTLPIDTPRVRVLDTLDDAVNALADWRRANNHAAN